jgi:hypothetical protein
MVTAAFKEIRSKYEPYFPAAFFIGGVLFDILTLQRIDDLITIGQQAAYLTVIYVVLLQMFFEEAKTGPQTSPLKGIKKYYLKYRMHIMHFFFGTLFSCFSFFFFKSASLFSSFLFLLIMWTLLVANEFEHVKNMGLPVKFALFSICSLCYFAYLVPTLIGFIGVTVFLLSMFVGCLPLVFATLWIQSKHEALFEKCKRQILVPNGLVLVLFLSLYLFKIIPPIPLSIPHMGIYHTVERTNEGFRLGHQREWWRVWNSGDQIFKAQKGDKIQVFFSVFSPTNFSDQVLVRWYLKDVRSGWVLQDSIPIKISGGRDEGFRGFGTKSNYQPGDWKVQVETTDGREIGRIYFVLELVPDEPRTFEYTVI